MYSARVIERKYVFGHGDGCFMGGIHSIDARIKELGGKVIFDDVLGIVATFYHVSLSSSEIEILSCVEGINTVAFYVSNIRGEDFKVLSANKGVRYVGVYSCENVADEIFGYLKLFPNLETVTLVDTSISESALDEFRVDCPRVKVSGPNCVQ